MLTPLLTVSIPTYNRAERLRVTLANVLAQIEALDLPLGAIEVVVTSNASPDHTSDLVANLMEHHSALRYFENDRNLGIDGNIHRAMVNARGKFVHLLSDDDVLLPGLYQHLHKVLQTTDAIRFLFLNVRALGGNDAPSGPPVITLGQAELIALPKDEFVRAVGVWMTFISSFVVDRRCWLGTPHPEQYIGTDIYLSYVAFNVLAQAGGGHISIPAHVLVRPMYSGSFRIFKAFASEWRRLLLEHAPAAGFAPSVTRGIFATTTRNFLPGCVSLAKQSSTLTRKEVGLLLANTWDIPAAWLFVYPVIVLPPRLVAWLREIRAMLRWRRPC